MKYDVDKIIKFMRKFISEKSTLDEQGADSAAGGGTGGAKSGKTPKKWESGRTFGKTYMNDPKYKWESGRTMGKTYMNDPKYVWTSGRNMGKTGGSDFA